MFEAKITVHIIAPELVAAIAGLVCPANPPLQVLFATAPATPSPAPVSPAPGQSFPVVPAPISAPTPVPLAAAPTYTIEQLAHAGADLYMRDPASGQRAQALLGQFGVQAVTQLPKERYGEFATALRGLGAKI